MKTEISSLHPEKSFIYQSSQAAGSTAGLIPGRASTELPVHHGAGLWYFMINRGGHPLRDLQRADGKAAAARPSLASTHGGWNGHRAPGAGLGQQQRTCRLPAREKYPLYICLYVYVPSQKQLQTPVPAGFGLSGLFKSPPMCIPEQEVTGLGLR